MENSTTAEKKTQCRQSHLKFQLFSKSDCCHISIETLKFYSRSMEALHFFGLSSDVPTSAPATPKLFDNLSENDETPNMKKRQRHFSLEDYNAMDESEDSSSSSSSNLSGTNNLVCSKRVRQNSIFFPNALDDSAVSLSNDGSFSSPPSSFGNVSSRRNSDFFSAANFFSDTPSSMSLELDNDRISNQLRAELEVRLLETLCPVPGSSGPRRKFTFELPPQLLSIIASHVIQEAANEPYGLKGKTDLPTKNMISSPFVHLQ